MEDKVNGPDGTTKYVEVEDNVEIFKDPLYLALKSAGADEKHTSEAVARQLFINSAFATKDDFRGLEKSLHEMEKVLRNDFSMLQGNFGTLNGNFDTLQGNFDTLNGKFDTLQGNFGTLKDVVNEVKVDQAKTFTKVENIEKNHGKAIGELKDDVNELKVGQANIFTKVENIEKNHGKAIGELKGDVNELKVGQAKIETTIEKQSKKQLIWLVSTIIGTSLLIVSILSAVFYLLSG